MANLKMPVATRGAVAFLQIVLVLIGLGALAFLLGEPHLEGRNAHATVFEVYFKDPFLAYAYVASIPFFVALYQGLVVLGYAGQDRVFSPAAAAAVRKIKICAIAMICFAAVGVLIIMLQESDDRAGGVVMGLVATFGSIILAAAAATVQRILQTAAAMKSGNDARLHHPSSPA
jgi:hypothetical protein